MKKAQGVGKADDLEQRYLTPEQQSTYDDSMAKMQRDEVEDALYELIAQNNGGNSVDAKIQARIDEGAAYGLTDTDYLLYRLALEMADKPNDSGKYNKHDVGGDGDGAGKRANGSSEEGRGNARERIKLPRNCTTVRNQGSSLCSGLGKDIS